MHQMSRAWMHPLRYVKNVSETSAGVVPNLFGTRVGTAFVEDNFFHQLGVVGDGLGRFKHVTLLVHSISVILVSAPTQIIRQ